MWAYSFFVCHFLLSMDCNKRHRPPSLMYIINKGKVPRQSVYFSLDKTSKIVVDDAYCNPSIAEVKTYLKLCLKNVYIRGLRCFVLSLPFCDRFYFLPDNSPWPKNLTIIKKIFLKLSTFLKRVGLQFLLLQILN